LAGCKNPHLDHIRSRIETGEEPTATVRDLLSWFQAERRGFWIVRDISDALVACGLVTVPDFRYAYIDGDLLFRAKPEEPPPHGEVLSIEPVEEAMVVDTRGELISGASDDATYRIGKLPPANRKPTSLTPNDGIDKAITLMMARDFSQIPVMTSDRELKGLVRWRTIAKRLALKGPASEVREVMEPAIEVSGDTSLFEALPLIVRHDYVLVRNPQDKTIQGIVTTSDLAIQFRELSEPFLLLGEIENYLRQMLAGKFSKEELSAARDPADAEREIGSIADLAFGEYIRVLENESNWARCGPGLNRKQFVEDMHRVRDLRNDVMHFDPDPVADEDLVFLRETARFLREMKESSLF